MSVSATLNGPGGSVSLGYGAATADEGISVEMIDDKDAMTSGSDGAIMHSLRASNTARITVRLLKTSPANAKLSQLYNVQKSAPILWGKNTLVVSDTARGDVVTGTEIAFTRQPSVVYAKDGNTNEWTFQGNVIEILGDGTN